MLVPALLGGLFIGVLSALPLVSVANYCCCLWIVAGGLLAAHLLQQEEATPIGPARGAAVGALAGVTGAVVWLLLSVVVDVLLAPFQARILAALLQNAQDMPPNVRAWFDGVAARQPSAIRLLAGFFLELVCGVAFGAAGGLLGSRVLRPRAVSGVLPPPLPPA